MDVVRGMKVKEKENCRVERREDSCCSEGPSDPVVLCRPRKSRIQI